MDQENQDLGTFDFTMEGLASFNVICRTGPSKTEICDAEGRLLFSINKKPEYREEEP